MALVRDEGVDSGWWQQMVTVGYEKLKGRRITGETQDADFQVGVSRTMDLPADDAWHLVTSPDGVQTWLGAGAPTLAEGARYELHDGRCVVNFHEEHLPDEAVREERRTYFRDALDRLQRRATSLGLEGP
ncbi:MAG: hypothetical protein GWN71_34515 [Gammaproteobacteria bacterium]|nr:hypothetical protein [Gemmatimonadota bacterium]NIU78489.1 hypothetical protein [Gammaproteobacteria bacterium]